MSLECLLVKDALWSEPEGGRTHLLRREIVDDTFASWYRNEMERYGRGDEIALSVNEQVINCLEHGPVLFEQSVDDARVYVTIRGQGTYDLSLWLRDEPPAIHKRGWGMALTKRLADYIFVGDGGRILNLIYEQVPAEQRAVG